MIAQRYGKPRQFLQLTNFSQNFILEVNWTDEDGSLVCRGNIAPGQVHFELCSEDHVWTLAAKPNEAGKPGKHAAQSSQQSLSGGSLSSSSQSHNVGYDTDRPAPMLIFRPSPACLADGRCVSMVWYPLVSVSATQTLYSQSKEQNHDKVLPCIHIQLMDPPKSATTSVNVTEQSLARLHRKPLMKTRVLNRWRNKKAHSSD